MAEGRGAEGEDWRSHLSIRYYLDAEHIGKSRAAVVSERAKYEVFALLIEYEDSGQHGGLGKLREQEDRKVTLKCARGMSFWRVGKGPKLGPLPRPPCQGFLSVVQH